MGLLDQILGSVLGSRQDDVAPRSSGSSTSTLTKALMLLLAAKAYQHYTSRPQGGPPPSGGGFGNRYDPRGGRMGYPGDGPYGGSPYPRGGGMEPGMGGPMGGGMGGLGGALSGGLGGLLGGLIGSGGLGAIVDRFRQSGYGDVADSWVGGGQNQRIAPDQLGEALGLDTIDDLARQTGMPREQLLSELSDVLPEAVDQFTPEGRLPNEDEVSRWG